MLEQKYWHPSITAERIMEAVERQITSLDNPGFCLVCGEEAEGVEPDAQNDTCESCGAEQVFGAAETADRGRAVGAADFLAAL